VYVFVEALDDRLSEHKKFKTQEHDGLGSFCCERTPSFPVRWRGWVVCVCVCVCVLGNRRGGASELLPQRGGLIDGAYRRSEGGPT
jgi:hypothetical protein